MRSCPVCSSEFANFLALTFHNFDAQRVERQLLARRFRNPEHRAICLPPLWFIRPRPTVRPVRADLSGATGEQTAAHSGHRPGADTVPVSEVHRRHRIRSADLFSPLADDIVDIMDMNIYVDNAFDFIVCSHVLEHVPDDRKAIAELYRVLDNNGVAILMVPILLTAQVTDEDPDETDVNVRWSRFGQDDHIRMYAKHDYMSRVREGGSNCSSSIRAPSAMARSGNTASPNKAFFTSAQSSLWTIRGRLQWAVQTN